MTKLIESLKKCSIEGNTVFLPSEILENYAEVRQALIKAGAKYNRNKFVFSTDAQPYIDRLINGSTNIKKEFQFYATPDEIADFMATNAFFNSESRILEPSAGHGAIIKAVQRENKSAHVFYCEIMPENQKVLSTIENTFFLCADFLTLDKSEKFDFILANPPFAKNQDIEHILKMYDHLNEGGRIITVSSNHWQTATGKKEKSFKNFVNDLDATIYPIDKGAFKNSGTMVSANILVIDKN